jgi:hypothetical protein
MARIEEESTMSRDQSIWSAARKRASSTSCSSSQTPAACQSRRRRQQLIPLPQPISLGSRSQRRPVCRMNRIPVSTARFSSGLRLGCRERRGFGGGSNGSMSAQRSSSRIGLAMSFRRRNNDKVNRNDRELTAPKHHFVKAFKSTFSYFEATRALQRQSKRVLGQSKHDWQRHNAVWPGLVRTECRHPLGEQQSGQSRV